MGGPTLTDRAKGISLGLGASLAWGTVPLCARYLTSVHTVDPILLNTARFGVASAILIAYCVATGRGKALLSAMDDAPRFILLGLLGVVAMGSLVMVAAQHTYSTIAVLLMNSNGIFIAMLAILAREKVPLVRYLGLVIGLAGCACVVVNTDQATPENVNHLIGGGAALAGALAWAVYTLLGKAPSRRHGGVVATTCALSMGSVVMIAWTVSRGTPVELIGWDLWVLLFVAVVPTAGGFVAWYAALEYVPANLIGPVQYAAPVLGILLGWLLLSEPIGWVFVAGAALVFVGVWIATRPRRAPQDGCR
ncbi:MAG TPA: DMT family transporter [Armatimonadota bacterium]|nr:DMT family transporter [Armatimonadota bacterium]